MSLPFAVIGISTRLGKGPAPEVGLLHPVGGFFLADTTGPGSGQKGQGRPLGKCLALSHFSPAVLLPGTVLSLIS